MRMSVAWPAAWQPALARFDAMSLRERVLIAVAVLASLLVVWDSVLMQPLLTRRAALLAELEGADPYAMSTAADDDTATDGGMAASTEEISTDPDPIGTALLQREALQTQLAAIDRQLQQVSAELIAPERMSDVLYDVLHQQHNLVLISLHNQPVRSLVPAAPDTAATQALGPGPYVHPVQLVIEGGYLDILEYLRALEALPWRLDWQSLHLDGSRHPLTRAQIEISTLGLEPAWLGTPARN